MSNRRFNTAEEARQVGMGSLPDALVASHLGITRQAVAAWRKRLGIAPPYNARPNYTPFVEYVKANPEATVNEVAAHFKKTAKTIRYWAEVTDTWPKPNPKYVPPTKRPTEMIVAALEGAKSVREVARRLGTHEAHAHYLLRVRGIRAMTRIPDGRKKP